MSNGNPDYVEYGSLATAPGPLECSGTTLSSFLLEGRFTNLVATCNRVFARPSGYRVIPIPFGPFCLATFGQIESIAARGGDYGDRGRVSERQIATWVPAWCIRRGGPDFLGMLVINMWLDNPISVASGREQYGYPKSWGWGSYPGEPDRRTGAARTGAAGRRYEVEVPALKSHHPDTVLEPQRLLVVEPVGASPLGAREEELGTEHDVARALLEAMTSADGGEAARGAEAEDGDGGPLPEIDGDDLELPLPTEDELPDEQLGEALATGLGDAGAASERLGRRWLRVPKISDFIRDLVPPVNQTFLRQFRHPEVPTDASEQAVVRAQASVTRFHGSRRLGPHNAKVLPLDSHPLGEDLGLAPDPRVKAAFEVRFDFSVDNGEVLS